LSGRPHNEEMQLTERGLLIGAPAVDDRCRPAIVIKSRSAADLRCSADTSAAARRKTMLTEKQFGLPLWVYALVVVAVGAVDITLYGWGSGSSAQAVLGFRHPVALVALLVCAVVEVGRFRGDESARAVAVGNGGFLLGGLLWSHVNTQISSLGMLLFIASPFVLPALYAKVCSRRAGQGG
jgi:hypothetical protein